MPPEALDRRILELSDWIKRDCREPDKIVAYAQDLRAAILRERAMTSSDIHDGLKLPQSGPVRPGGKR